MKSKNFTVLTWITFLICSLDTLTTWLCLHYHPMETVETNTMVDQAIYIIGLIPALLLTEVFALLLPLLSRKIYQTGGGILQVFIAFCFLIILTRGYAAYNNYSIFQMLNQ